MGFTERLSTAKEFEEAAEAYCLAKSDAVAKNGTEHTHPAFVELLRKNDSPQSKLIRFAPDGVLLRAGGVIHWEAKASINIERDAYEVYYRYFEMGCKVLVFIQDKQANAYCQWIEKIGFIPSIAVVGKFGPRAHPIDEDDWICPRKGHGYAGGGSGTSYKEVDLSSLKPLPDFYEVVRSRAA